MDAVLVLFVVGLISLFLGIYTKPLFALISNLVGLVAAFLLFYYSGTYTSPLKSHYFTLVFGGTGILLSMMCITMTAMVLLFGFESQSKETTQYADLTSDFSLH